MSANHGGCDGGGCGEGGGGCGGHDHGAPDEQVQKQQLNFRLSQIKNKILVLSGKGGVGKSTVAVNLALALAREGKTVGLLDVDVHGPTVPVMLGLEDQRPGAGEGTLIPVETQGIKVISLGFMLPDHDSPVIWRGPLKMGVIEQFLRDVEWGKLDYLVVDAPPGTGDEPLSVGQLIPGANALVVTTPQRVATFDVRKSIQFCRQLSMPVAGVVENMNGMICPHCGELIKLFPEGEVNRMAQDLDVKVLASLPMSPKVSEFADKGESIAHDPDSPIGKAMRPLVEAMLALDEVKEGDAPKVDTDSEAKEGVVRFAIPLADGMLTAHFGHCEKFAVLDVDEKTGKVLAREDLTPPAHAPGVIPKWVSEQGVKLVLAGGMGIKAQDIFRANGVDVKVGCPAEAPEKLVEDYFKGQLVTGENLCDH